MSEPARRTVTVTRDLQVTPEEIWEVVSDTSRYADWVDGCLAVTRHHGTAAVGETYAERNRTVGPVTTNSEWTVLEVVPLRKRVDSGTGFDPLHDMVNTFTFEPLDIGGTRMTYAVDVRIGLGPLGLLGPLVAAVLGKTLRAEFTTSMRQLEELIVSERTIADRTEVQ